MATIAMVTIWTWTCDLCERFIRTEHEDQIHYHAQDHRAIEHYEAWVLQHPGPEPQKAVWAFHVKPVEADERL